MDRRSDAAAKQIKCAKHRRVSRSWHVNLRDRSRDASLHKRHDDFHNVHLSEGRRDRSIASMDLSIGNAYLAIASAYLQNGSDERENGSGDYVARSRTNKILCEMRLTDNRGGIEDTS